jgi:cell division protease FtsH
VLPGLDPVHKVSIVGRGFGALGYTLSLPLEDRYLRTKAELQNELAVLLGGRTAELLIFGEVSTGDHNDLLRATDIARSMVTELGFSELFGPVNHEGRKRSAFLDTPYVPERGNYAEETARLVDAEIKRLIAEAEGTANRILTERRDTLDDLTAHLLEKEVLEGAEIRRRLGVGIETL